MTDTMDNADDPAQTSPASCTEGGMRDTLNNLEVFSLMMSRRSSIRALEILEVAPPGRERPPAEPARPAVIVVHPATRKKDP
ncbi:MAG: hypothetical protein IPM20_01645 [Gammaproteobacteria bacterium]|nr:hypothetical protein [Gammaproteobacteria bacterium]